MAVFLTYFSITASYLPIAIHHQMVNGPTKKITSTTESTGTDGMEAAHAPSEPSTQPTSSSQTRTRPGLLAETAMLLAIVIAAPFFALPSAGGVLSLLIIFWGLQRAWFISGQTEVVVTGPYGKGV